MNQRSLLALLLTMAALAGNLRAGLSAGANVLPYEIHNTATGKEYCQMCEYSERPATVAAYGKLHDDKFWSDLEKLQAIQKDYKNIGFFGQVLDSTDSSAIQAEAKKHGISFPVVYAVDPDWEKVYQVGNISRTIYYSSQFKIVWSGIGLDDGAKATIESRLQKDSRS